MYHDPSNMSWLIIVSRAMWHWMLLLSNIVTCNLAFTTIYFELHCAYIYPSVCLFVCVSVPSREVPFKCLFAPIYKGPRSNLFGFLDSLGKSYGKEVVSDFAILARKWSKIAAPIYIFLGALFKL